MNLRLNPPSSNSHLTLYSSTQDWLWFLSKIDRMLTSAHLSVFSGSVEPLRSASMQFADSCVEKSNETSVELQMFSPTLSSISKTAFVSLPEQNNAAFLAPSVVVDVSFILICKAAIDAIATERGSTLQHRWLRILPAKASNYIS